MDGIDIRSLLRCVDMDVALTTVHSPHFVWCVQVFALVSDRSGVGMDVQS